MGVVEVLDNGIPELPPIKSPLRDSTNEQSVPKGNLRDIVVVASLSVSKAMLK